MSFRHFPVEMQHCSFDPVFFRYHLGDYGGEILNEVKLNRPEKEMGTTPSSLHNGNHHKVQECKVKVRFFFPAVSLLFLGSSLLWIYFKFKRVSEEITSEILGVKMLRGEAES